MLNKTENILHCLASYENDVSDLESTYWDKELILLLLVCAVEAQL